MHINYLLCTLHPDTHKNVNKELWKKSTHIYILDESTKLYMQ